MNEKILTITKNMTHGNNSLSINDVSEIEETLGCLFPSDYKEYMLSFNYSEGEIGDSSYLVLWPLESLIEYNLGYATNEFIPGIILIGSDGGDEAYGINIHKNTFVSVPFIDMSHEATMLLGLNFTEFLSSFK